MDILSGRARGAGATILRGALSLVEPFYVATMRLRNVAYDRGIFKSHPLPRPTISVGNVTTGGTGKTPVVQWLAEQLIARGLHPAILLRGYRAHVTGGSDEQTMLAEQFGSRASVIANPDRVAGAQQAMRRNPTPDVFILDDAFQHRRAQRQFDLVLIDATNPFGFGHVLPRGLLREPISGVRRADAILITRCNDSTTTLETQLRRHNPRAPIYHSSHQIRDVDQLNGRRVYVFCGIGNPQSFMQQFDPVEVATFPDHHAYTNRDMELINQAAAAFGADIMVTTEKDWVKVRSLPAAREGLPIWRAKLEIQFQGDEGQQLLNQVLAVIGSAAQT